MNSKNNCSKLMNNIEESFIVRSPFRIAMRMGLKKMLFKGLLCISMLCGSFFADAMAQKPWTFLVYMAAANSLSSYAPLDLQEMMKLGSNDNINIIVYLTTQEYGQPKVTKKLYIQKDAIMQIGDDMVRDSGDVSTLKEALEWACVNFPSDHTAAVLWNHGAGPLNREITLLPKGVCYDDDTNHYLTDRDCLEAFSWARDTFRNGKKFDIIAFDACLMASLEMAYTLISCADYMVASEETIPVNGYQYADLLSAFETQNLTPLAFAQRMVSTYQQEYAGITDYTLSVTDLNVLQALVDNNNIIAQFLVTQLKGSNQLAAKATIKKATSPSACLSFDGTYIDLGQFYKNLLKNISGFKLSPMLATQFKQILNAGITLFSSVVKANVMSSNYPQATGLSMYFARYTIEPSYYNLYWTEKNPNWLQFLKAYLSYR